MRATKAYNLSHYNSLAGFHAGLVLNKNPARPVLPPGIILFDVAFLQGKFPTLVPHHIEKYGMLLLGTTGLVCTCEKQLHPRAKIPEPKVCGI
jgi:hypothetical protein